MAGRCSSVQWRCGGCSQDWVTAPTLALHCPAPRTLTLTLPIMTSAVISNELIGHKREEGG